MPEDHAVFGHWISLLDEIAHRHALQHHRGRGLIANVIGQLHELVRRDEPFLGIAAKRPGIRHAVADGDLAHILADGYHLPCALAAGRERERGLRIKAGSMINVDVVHAGGVLFDLGLARSGLANICFLPLQNFRAAIGVNADRMGHG